MNLPEAATLCERLSKEDLKLPFSVTSSTADDTEEGRHNKRSLYLKELLQRDPAIFLERHGHLLGEAEKKNLFDPLADSYEVRHHLERLNSSNTATRTKNRRLAHMNRLLKDQALQGSYFSEASMRKRAPLLYQQYTNNQRPEGMAAAASSKLSDMLLFQHDELQMRQRLSEQQHAEDLIEHDESESESGSVDTAAEHPQDQAAADAAGPEPALTTSQASEEQAASREDLADLLEVMKMRFLNGQDADVTDYREIDANETLDDDWLKVAGQDAEDRYFDAD